MEFFHSKTYAVMTQKSYSSQLKKYMTFCNEMGLTPVPASQQQVELYIAYLTETLKYASIVKYLNIVRLLHVEAGLPNPVDNVSIKTLLRGVKRVLGDKVTHFLLHQRF